MTLGVGVVGAGWMGGILLKRLAERSDVEVRGLCQRSREKAVAVLGPLGLDERLWTDDYARLLADPAIDAVFLCGPNAHHGPQAIAALESGKHVFCEKPCATRFSEFRRQLELAERHPELITFVDYILHFDEMEQRLRQLVADGAFGTLTQVQVNYRHPVNIAGDKAWKLRGDLMGDAIGMGIVHALWAMLNAKAPQARPSGVFASSRAGLVREFDDDPIWNIHVEFGDGATGTCLGNIESGVGYDAYHGLFGTEGAFVFDSLADRPLKVRYRSAHLSGDAWVYPLDVERCRRDGFAELAWPTDSSTPDSGDVVNHQTAACVAHFVECVKAGAPSPLSFVASRTVAELGWAARIAAAERRLVPLPLDMDAAEAFFGD